MERAFDATVASETAQDRRPRTARGERTRQALIAAAGAEFGEKGFHEASITSITQRAGVALGSFYTYFGSKDELFRALVKSMSERVRDFVAPALKSAPDAVSAERSALQAFLQFARDNKEIYRIIDESEFVDPDSFRSNYETTADRIVQRLQRGTQEGGMRGELGEVEAWAIMGMNVFLGLRYGVWSDESDIEDVARRANRLIAHGIVDPKD